MSRSDERWLDDKAGPLVRSYALTGGRTRATGQGFDLLAVVRVARGPAPDPHELEPELLTILERCRRPTSVADLASDLDLPIIVLRVLLADLRERDLVTIARPSPAPVRDMRVLQDVLNGLRRL